MTLEGTLDHDGSMTCYRHPDRETWIRCGRCDRPICTRCAMQGPVGMRCKQCGKPKYDPLTSFTPVQLATALGVAVVAGTLGGIVGLQIGFFIIFVGAFMGGLIVEAVVRVVGFKHGPVMVAVIGSGIVVGAFIALVANYQLFWTSFDRELVVDFDFYLRTMGVWALVYAVAAWVGAYSRIR